MTVGLYIHLDAGPVGVDLAVLLDEDVVENVVGDAVLALFRDGGVGKGLVVGHVQTLIEEVEAVAHTAAVQAHVGKVLLQVPEDGVVFLLVEVFRGGLGVVVAELDGDAVGQETLGIVHQPGCRIVFIQHAVDAGGAGNAGDDLIRRLLHILHQMAGNIHAGDLVLVFLREGQHFLRRAVGLHGEGGVDINLVGGRDGVQHLLQSV